MTITANERLPLATTVPHLSELTTQYLMINRWLCTFSIYLQLFAMAVCEATFIRVRHTTELTTTGVHRVLFAPPTNWWIRERRGVGPAPAGSVVWVWVGMREGGDPSNVLTNPPRSVVLGGNSTQNQVLLLVSGNLGWSKSIGSAIARLHCVYTLHHTLCECCDPRIKSRVFLFCVSANYCTKTSHLWAQRILILGHIMLQYWMANASPTFTQDKVLAKMSVTMFICSLRFLCCVNHGSFEPYTSCIVFLTYKNDLLFASSTSSSVNYCTNTLHLWHSKH